MNRIPTHPGEVLLEEFLIPLGLSQAAFAKHLGVSPQHINEIVRQKRGLTPTMAWLFGQALGTTPEFWLNLQSAYDLVTRQPKRHVSRLLAAA
jgi:antitoxin HigA-1